MVQSCARFLWKKTDSLDGELTAHLLWKVWDKKGYGGQVFVRGRVFTVCVKMYACRHYRKYSCCSQCLCDFALFLVIYFILFSLPGFVASVRLISCVWLPIFFLERLCFFWTSVRVCRCVLASDVLEMSQPTRVMMPPGLLCFNVSAKHPTYFYLSFHSLTCSLVSTVSLP